MIDFTLPFLLGSCVILDRHPASYHVERGKMPLHDAVVVNC